MKTSEKPNPQHDYFFWSSDWLTDSKDGETFSPPHLSETCYVIVKVLPTAWACGHSNYCLELRVLQNSLHGTKFRDWDT